jgi:hypothetical protein
MLLANRLTEQVIGSAIEVHRNTGADLLEVVHLRMSGIRVGLLLNFNAPRPMDGLRRAVM